MIFSDIVRKPSVVEKRSIVEVTKAPTEGGVYTIYINDWWVVVDECVLMHRGRNPQCNSDERVARMLQKRLYPDAEVRQLPIVYMPYKYDCEAEYATGNSTSAR